MPRRRPPGQHRRDQPGFDKPGIGHEQHPRSETSGGERADAGGSAGGEDDARGGVEGERVHVSAARIHT